MSGESHFEITFKNTQRLSKNNEAEIKRIEEEKETLERIGRWARITEEMPGSKLPDTLEKSDCDRLRLSLWQMAKDDSRRVATRFALETIVRIVRTDKDGKPLPGIDPIPELISRRTVVPSEHVLVALDAEKNIVATAATRPEAFEWSQPLLFPALGTHQVRAESGFARFKAPAAGATLAALVNKTEKTLELLRDTERRILTTIRFAAVPDWANPDSAVAIPPKLMAGLNKTDAALIADYDLYELDLDDLDAVKPPLKPVEFGQNSRVWSRARRVGRIEQLAQDEARLVPEGNKELIGWQAHYPSVTHQMARGAALAPAAGGDQPLLSAWYSARESAALFPERRPRLRFFPQPPEDVINELMRGGTPNKLEVIVTARPGSPAAKLKNWSIPKPTLFDLQVTTDLKRAYAPKDTDKNMPCMIVTRSDSAALQPADIRHALLAVGFVAFPGLEDDDRVNDPNDEKNYNPLIAWLQDPRVIDGLEVQIEGRASVASRKADATPESRPISTGKSTLEVDLRSPIHPLLEELLSELAYEAPPGSQNLYRTLSVMVQPPPPVLAADAASFLAKLPAAADPYGWGALQVLGLAAAIRLFDVAQDEFVAPQRAAAHVDAVFTTVLKRWCKELGTGVSLGQPFVEVHLKPARDRDTGPFDAVLKGGTEFEEAKLELEDDALAVLQVSLRPSPLSAWRYWRQKLRWRGLMREKVKDRRDKAKSTEWKVANDGDWVVATANAPDKPIVLKKDTLLRGRYILRRSVAEIRMAHPGGTAAAQLARKKDGPIAVLDATGEASIQIPTRPDLSKLHSNRCDPDLTLLARLPADKCPKTVFNGLRCVVALEKRSEPCVVSIKVGESIVPGPFLVLKSPADARKVVTHALHFRLNAKKCPIATVGEWREHKEPARYAPDPFARFQELTPPEWAAAFGARFDDPKPTDLAKIPAAARAFRSFERALTAFSRELKLPEPKTISAIAGTLVQWTQRFLEHGASTASGTATPGLALAAPIRALPWKLAADANGFLSLTLLHSDRWSHTRAYAVKPLSRYHPLLKALRIKSQKEAEPLATEELPLPRPLGFAITHSLRTEKIEPPVFIGARRVKWDAADLDENDVLEVIVARHGEEALANSNRALFSRLGLPTALMTFARVYRSPDWLKRLVDFGAKQNPPITPEPLPTHLPEPAKRLVDDARKQITGPIIGEIAQLYPQLWKGAEIKRLDPIPPQYKLVTLAAERAGAVVSPVSAVVQEDLPRRALESRQDDLMPSSKDHPRKAVLLLEDLGDGAGRLSLRHPLLSHAELTPAAATHWQQPKNTDICWWPDPDVAYVLQRRWTQGTQDKKTEVREEDLELRLGAFTDHVGVPIMVQARARGTRFKVAKQPEPKLEQTSNPLLWTLETQLDFAPPAPGQNPVTLERITVADWTDAGHALAFNQKAKAFAAILFPHRVSADLEPKLNETPVAYFARLEEFRRDLATAVTAALQPSRPWHQGRLQLDLVDRLQALADWIIAKGAPAAGDTPNSLRDDAKLPIAVDGVYRIDDQPLPSLAGLAQWAEQSAQDGLLAIWALGPSTTMDALDDAVTFPPLALKNGRLRALLARKIMGVASGMTLRVVDARAQPSLTGFDIPILSALRAGGPSLTGQNLRQKTGVADTDLRRIGDFITALKRLVAQKEITAHAANFETLTVLDDTTFTLTASSRRTATPGVFEQRVRLPDWLETTVNPTP